MYSTFEFFGKTIGTYTVSAIIGGLVCGFFFFRESKRRWQDESKTMVLSLFVMGGALVGGSLLYALTRFNLLIELFCNFDKIGSGSQFFNYALQIFGGSVFYGGLFGALIAGGFYAKRAKLDLVGLTCIASFCIPLFHVFGRIGCFLGGCCYGIESAFGFTATHSIVPQVNGVSRFPVQLLEASMLLVLFFIFYSRYKSHKNSKFSIPLYLASYAVCRFFNEFLRGDLIRGFIFNLSTSQFISIIVFITSIVIMLILHYKSQNNKSKANSNY